MFVPPRLPKASLKYPTLAAANVDARESRTAIAVSGSGAGTFEDERPGRPDEAPAGSRKPAVIAIGRRRRRAGDRRAVFALKPSSKPAAPRRAVPTRRRRRPRRRSRPPRRRLQRPRRRPPAATPKPAAAAAETPAAVGRRDVEAGPLVAPPPLAESTEDVKANPLHRAIPLPAETPAELKTVPDQLRSGPRPPE